MDATTTADPCGCPDYGLSRRRLLGAAAATTGLLAAGQMFGDAFRQVAYGAPAGGNVVVVLSMRGGADGLSMVVPSTAADQAVLAKARPDIYLPASSLIAGDARFGLHPAFAPLQDMWNVSKNFAAVHAVGLPAPNRSHFEAMNVIEDAGVGGSARSGWINRTVGLGTSYPEQAVQMGSVLLPESLVGAAPALGATQVSDVRILPFDPNTSPTRRSAVSRMWETDTGPGGAAVRSAVATTQVLDPLATAASASDSANPVHKPAYPAGPLQSVLANTSALIRADVGAKFVTVDYGNWDMHQNLGRTGSGWMFDQVTHLAASLKAFFDDLGPAASRVTLVTLSEFGRRVAQNGSGGVDHGWGNAMLLLGAGVKGGQVYGGWKGLDQLTDGDVTVQTNFQSVLWEVVSRRFPALSGARSTLLPDASTTPLGVVA
ncbi:hypothetical protein GCM10011519_03260 [Marmoricola endophyticus]|uniref:DUF1501 domain-containing protein n=1 Tax=Marmoricola endophyticus TaxID=2040280 RepID=A0A917B9P1_9ACTN|nr:DUF1501 domain-containing protein [Marmoricola endophyticus]GGF33151.1 hypothetical protein GCM10011519_03260 [Marmoricola endophyticus]